MTPIFSGLERIEALGYDVIALIAGGEKEQVDTVLQKLGDSTLVHHLISTFKLYAIQDNNTYDLEAWEKAFGKYNYMQRYHDVQRKCGITKDDDGLLLVINILLSIISRRPPCEHKNKPQV